MEKKLFTKSKNYISTIVIAFVILLALFIPVYAEDTSKSNSLDTSMYTEVPVPSIDEEHVVTFLEDPVGGETDDLIRSSYHFKPASGFSMLVWNPNEWEKYNYANDDYFLIRNVYKYASYKNGLQGIKSIECTSEEFSNSYFQFRYNKDRKKVAVVATINNQAYALLCPGVDDGLMYVKLTNAGSFIKEPESDYNFTWWTVERFFYGLGNTFVYLKTKVDGKTVYLLCNDNGLYVSENADTLTIAATDKDTAVQIRIPNKTATSTDGTLSCYYANAQLWGNYFSSEHNYFSTKSDALTLLDSYVWNDYKTATKDDNALSYRTGYLGINEASAKFDLYDAVDWIAHSEVELYPVQTVKDVYKASTIDTSDFDSVATVNEVPLWKDNAKDGESYVLYAYTQYPLYININGLEEGDNYTTITGSCISEKIYSDCLTFESGDSLMAGNWAAFKLPNKYECGRDYTYDWSSLKITDLDGNELEKYNGSYRIYISRRTINDEEYLYLSDMPNLGIKISIDVKYSEENFAALHFNNFAYAGGLPCISSGYSWTTNGIVDVNQTSIKLCSSNSPYLSETSFTSIRANDQYASNYSYSYTWYVKVNDDVSEIVKTNDTSYTWTLSEYPAGTEMDVYCVATKTLNNATITERSNNIHLKVSGYKFAIDVIDIDTAYNSTSDRVIIVIDKNSINSEINTYDQIFNDIKHLYVTDSSGNTTEITSKLGSSGGQFFRVKSEKVDLYHSSGISISYETKYLYSQAFQWVVPGNGTYTFKAVTESGYGISKTITIDHLSSVTVLDVNENKNNDIIYFTFSDDAINKISKAEVKNVTTGSEWTDISGSRVEDTTVFGVNNTTYSGTFYKYTIPSIGVYQFRFKDSNGSYTYWTSSGYYSVATHTHTLNYQEATEATCTTPALKAYYYCEDCEHVYLDANGETEATYSELITAAKNGHNYQETSRQYVHFTCYNDSYDLVTSECSVCHDVTTSRDFKKYNEGFKHVYKEEWTSFGASGHAHVCNWCDYYTEFEAHEYDNDQDTSCNKCGYTRYFDTYKYLKDGNEFSTSGYVHKVSSDDIEWISGWYVVTEDITINHSVKVTGDVNLILCDGATLTVIGSTVASNYDTTDNDGVNAGISVKEGCSFSVYGQANQTGKLDVSNDYIWGAAIGAALKENCGKIYIYSGNVIVSSQFTGNYIGNYTSQDSKQRGNCEGVFIDGGLGIYRLDIEREEAHDITTNLADTDAMSAANSEIGYASLVIKPRGKYLNLTKLSGDPIYGDTTEITYLVQFGSLGVTTLSKNFNCYLLFYTDSNYQTVNNAISSNKVVWSIDKDSSTGNTILKIKVNSSLDAGNYYFKLCYWGATDADDFASNGKLIQIAKRELTLSSDSATKEYDGTELTCNTVKVTSGSFVDSEGFTSESNSSQFYVGSTENKFTYKLASGTKQDNYIINCEYGTLTVEPKSSELVITTESGKKTYDSTPLVNKNYTYTDGILAEGDVLNVKFSGSITDVGSTPNTIASYMVTRSGIDVTNCYTFGTPVLGTLTVEKSNAIAISKPTDTTKVYDGNSISKEANVNIEEGTSILYSTDGINYDETIPSFTNAGNYTVYVKAVNNNYETAETSFPITISRKNVTVTAVDATKYIGEEDPQFTATVEGTLGTDTVEYSVTRESGEKYGNYAINVSGTVNQGNYKITFVKGNFFIDEKTAPVISGIKDNETFYVTRGFKVSDPDSGVKSVTINGKNQVLSDDYKLAGNKESTYTIVACDNEDNSVTYVVNAKPISDLAESIKYITVNNVTSEDETTIEAVEDSLEALDVRNITQAEQAVIDEINEKIDSLRDKNASTAKSLEDAEKLLKDLNVNNVNSNNKNNLKATLAKLNGLSDENLTNKERSKNTELKTKCTALLNKIAEIENAQVNKEINDTQDINKEEVKLEDEEVIKQTIEDIQQNLNNNSKNMTAEEINNSNNAINRLKEALESIDNSKEVIEKINNIPTELAIEDEKQVNEAYENYNKLSEHEKELIDKEYVDKLTEAKSTADKLHDECYTPEIVDGAKQNVDMKENNCQASFRSEAPLSQLVGVKVDEKEIDASQYDKKEGSTIITLHNDFLKKLGDGEHTIEIVSAYGSAATVFTIQNATYQRNVIIVIAITAIVTMSLVIILKRRKRV